MNILHLDSSARREGSVGRQLSQRLAAGLRGRVADANITHRDLDASLPLLDEALLTAMNKDPAERTSEEQAQAAVADGLISELEQADVVVLGVPIYNFGVPAALKAWIDLIARARRTFRYTDQGPLGLLADRPVYLVVTSGGTAIDSDADFATPYLRQVLGFVGLHDVRVVGADRLMITGEEGVQQAEARVDDAIAHHVASPVRQVA